jgi:predicted ATP-dependent endonuclease of OLD family
MNIKHLQLARMRAFDQAEFDFTPGMNLLVGVNGVGKTTVLDALRICLSRILPAVTASRSRPISFDAADIRGKASALTARLFFELARKDFEFLVHKQRERTVTHKLGGL